jgi:hypothetical protein
MRMRLPALLVVYTPVLLAQSQSGTVVGTMTAQAGPVVPGGGDSSTLTGSSRVRSARQERQQLWPTSLLGPRAASTEYSLWYLWHALVQRVRFCGR